MADLRVFAVPFCADADELNDLDEELVLCEDCDAIVFWCEGLQAWFHLDPAAPVCFQQPTTHADYHRLQSEADAEFAARGGDRG
jgi:hypothetical protein